MNLSQLARRLAREQEYAIGMTDIFVRHARVATPGLTISAGPRGRRE